MCGACAGHAPSSNTTAARGMTGGRGGHDYGEPPPSPYYQAHLRPRRPLAARLLLDGWPYALLVAALAVGIYWASGIPPPSPPPDVVTPEQSTSLPPPQQQTQTRQEQQKQTWQQKAVERTHTRQLGAPLGLNLTRDAEPLWQGYREVLLAHTDEEYYGAFGFDEVDADTVLIAEMWSKVEKSRGKGGGGVDGKKYERMALDIHVRGAALRNASVEFGHFLGNRTLVVQEFLRRGVTAGSSFSESELKKLDSLLNNTDSSSSNTAAGGPPRVSTLSPNELANYDNRSAEALARTAERLMAELIRQHQALFRPIEHGVERICRLALPAARAAEARVIGALVAASGGRGAELWKERQKDRRKKEHGHGGSTIKKLEHGVCELDRKHVAMRRALGWLPSRFATLRGRHLEKVRVRDAWGRARETAELLFWVQSAVELLDAWSTVLMDIEEGVLIGLRKKGIAEEKAQRAAEAAEAGGNAVAAAAVTDYDQSWNRWKLENCGGTSCYDKDTALTRLKHVFFQKKPLADEARDERERLGWDVKLWKGIYEKACCENGTLAKTLKYGRRTPEFQVGLEDVEW
ncbi:hypothetical protein DL769_001596 [Monosporascus sp. CRB-8-3]|nr:hypothetical protein DL769_001596 [Monosporascus sp. CRB-8-3]